MLTSSPTISAPSSPSAAFRPHSHSHARPYHASPSSSTSSPRFGPQVSSASSRRAHTSSVAATTHSPVPAFARSPQIRRREYSDAGTQYTPPGFPPTYRPAPSEAPPALPDSSRAVSERRETSAQPIATDPPEPVVRVDPLPVLPVQAPAAQPTGTTTTIPTTHGEPGEPEGNATEAQASSIPHGQPTSAKRARGQDPNAKVMPLEYETCDVKDLGILISDMLMELVRLNDKFPLRDGKLTRFHSRAPPGISVRDYLNRLIVHATLSPPILLSIVFYVDKLCAVYDAFTISSLTVHRFLITAATVAAKGLSDSFWTNSLYARVGGVSVRELALLELEFLRRLEWRIVPKPETLVDYYRGLVERAEGYVMEKEPEPVQASDSDAATATTTAAAPSLQPSSSVADPPANS
ncbi:cyclin-domain-containing protein [Clohesyomyces aquaticus]|uniref:Cyclin-domain-containing protein n=1 Tax=Clohesyomyces aquaticus TaxID=1231657 RepID=A0A1Y2A680_9PLEO|nr:cyclin-domain-containing protein [Clohesyomyces aquaticus]